MKHFPRARRCACGIAVASAIALALSPTAHATPVSYTTSGIVQSGVDHIGLFGTAGADLAGKAFVQTIRTDARVAADAAQWRGAGDG